MGQGPDTIEAYRTKPHLLPIGRDFINIKFECVSCHQKQVPDAFGHIPRTEAAVRINGEIRGLLLHPICKRCRAANRSKWAKHPKFTKGLHSYFSRLLTGTKGGAATRSISVLIDVDDLLELYFLQDGRCAMSGYPMMVQRKSPRFQDPVAASVDRIDSSGRYCRSNIQLVCARVNVMKGDMHHNDMIEWCKRILANQYRKEDELLKLVS